MKKFAFLVAFTIIFVMAQSAVINVDNNPDRPAGYYGNLQLAMNNLIEEFTGKINSYYKLPFTYTDHLLKRCIERNISLDKIYLDISTNINLINVEKQNYNKYKLIYQEKHKQKFEYIIELNEKGAEIISAWIINSKLQRKINKENDKKTKN